MNDLSWIKLKVAMFDDDKIRVIESMDGGDAKLIIWIKLLTLAGKCNRSGFLMISDSIHYTAEMISVVIGRKLTEVKMALDVFQSFGMIEIENNIIAISNWGKHQNEKSIEEFNEKNRIRQRKFKDRKKQLMLPKALVTNEQQIPYFNESNENNVTSNVTDNVKNNKEITLASQENKNKNIDITIPNGIVRTKRDKSASSLHSEIKKLFKEKYLELFDAEYYWKAKDAGACEQFIKQTNALLRSRSPDYTDKDTIEAAQFIFKSISDKWILEHFELSIINSKFNEIVAQIKKSSKQSTTKATDITNQILEEWNLKS